MTIFIISVMTLIAILGIFMRGMNKMYNDGKFPWFTFAAMIAIYYAYVFLVAGLI